MLNFQSNTDISNTTFNESSEEIGEQINVLYKRVHGWETGEQNNVYLAGYPIEEIIEIIDTLRTPLAEKVFDEEELSLSEKRHLEMLEILTDKILNEMAPTPKEPIEVKMALQHARRIAKR